MIHAAGWLEGGLTVSYEKLITDIEVLQHGGRALCRRRRRAPTRSALTPLSRGRTRRAFLRHRPDHGALQTEFYEPHRA